MRNSRFVYLPISTNIKLPANKFYCTVEIHLNENYNEQVHFKSRCAVVVVFFYFHFPPFCRTPGFLVVWCTCMCSLFVNLWKWQNNRCVAANRIHMQANSSITTMVHWKINDPRNNSEHPWFKNYYCTVQCFPLFHSSSLCCTSLFNVLLAYACDWLALYYFFHLFPANFHS